MTSVSQNLKGYDGANPFRESQAREYSGKKIVQEFFPTTIYQSLFNEQNEILIGTRGSGKTILLRMLSYSHLREFKGQSNLEEIAKTKSFVGFYVPLHLEFVRRMSVSSERSIQYFTFSLNCTAAMGLLAELKCLLRDLFQDEFELRKVEYKILKTLQILWDVKSARTPATLEDFAWDLDVFYARKPMWEDKAEADIPVLARSVLMPIKFAVQRLTHLLGLDPNLTQWAACIDEAEFLPEAYIRALNTFMRSEKRPLTVKMATLPFKHSTFETLLPGVMVEPHGNDFNYRLIDYEPDHDDFRNLTNHIAKTRLAKCGVAIETLEDFLGTVGKGDEGLDYYRLQFGGKAAEKESILEKIRAQLSDARQARFDLNRGNAEVMKQQYLKKYSPVLYVREMKKANSEGNKTAAWFAGDRMVRRVADGNPRRFLQLMHNLVQVAINEHFTPKSQHRTIEKYVEQTNAAIVDLPGHGFTAKAIIDSVGGILSNRVHNGPLREAGCEFQVEAELLADATVLAAMKVAVGYSHIMLPPAKLTLDSETRFRLSYLHAAHFWLPMRKGDPVPKLTAKTLGVPLSDPPAKSADELAASRIRQMQLGFQFEEEFLLSDEA